MLGTGTLGTISPFHHDMIAPRILPVLAGGLGYPGTFIQELFEVSPAITRPIGKCSALRGPHLINRALLIVEDAGVLAVAPRLFNERKTSADPAGVAANKPRQR